MRRHSDLQLQRRRRADVHVELRAHYSPHGADHAGADNAGGVCSGPLRVIRTCVLAVPAGRVCMGIPGVLSTMRVNIVDNTSGRACTEGPAAHRVLTNTAAHPLTEAFASPVIAPPGRLAH